MAELLIELLSEDLPARMQKEATSQLYTSLMNRLVENGILAASRPATEADMFSTPRRIGVVMRDLPLKTADTVEEQRGPRTDAPEQAIQGFLKGNGLSGLDQCVQKETPKGTFWFLEIHKKGVDTATALTDIIPDVIQNLSWPKSMNWGAGRMRYARPLQSVLAVFDGKTVSGEVDLGGSAAPLVFGNVTKGHRFLAPAEITVKNFADYKAKLEKAFVLIDREDRKKNIWDGAQKIAAAEKLALKEDEKLLEEIVGLVEYPVVLAGGFDKAFLDVPAECLVSTMKSNQKYIPLFDAKGALASRFIVVANNKADDGGTMIIKGNEKVLSARLSDAKFFWDQDRKIKLADRLPRLKQLKFHDKLGSIHDKVGRLEQLSAVLAPLVGAKPDHAAKAAALCKADLVSNMVFEFPELQGIAGGYLARTEGMDQAIATAITDHYKPAGLDDDVPTDPCAVCVALADKVDTLAGFFGIDEKPTGSKDPFALRRAALGIIRIILENNLPLDLGALFGAACDLFGQKGAARDKTVSELLTFLNERLKVALKDKGLRHDILTAVFARTTGGDIADIVRRAEELQKMLSTEDGVNLLAGYKRANNILAKSDFGVKGDHLPDNALLTLTEEKNLYSAFREYSPKIIEATQNARYSEAMELVAKLRAPIDAFFDKVTVNDNDPQLRENRLRMLASIKHTIDQIADFSQI